MCDLSRQAVPRFDSRLFHCGVSEIGDLICPHCRGRLRTPMFCFVKAGWTRCALCHEPIRVTAELARIANRCSHEILAGVPLRCLKRPTG